MQDCASALSASVLRIVLWLILFAQRLLLTFCGRINLRCEQFQQIGTIFLYNSVHDYFFCVFHSAISLVWDDVVMFLIKIYAPFEEQFQLVLYRVKPVFITTNWTFGILFNSSAVQAKDLSTADFKEKTGLRDNSLEGRHRCFGERPFLHPIAAIKSHHWQSGITAQESAAFAIYPSIPDYRKKVIVRIRFSEKQWSALGRGYFELYGQPHHRNCFIESGTVENPQQQPSSEIRWRAANKNRSRKGTFQKTETLP